MISLRATTMVMMMSAALCSVAYGDLEFSEDFTGFTGAGFSPNPTTGQLDSDLWSITGMSQGDLNFGDVGTSSDFTGSVSSGQFVSSPGNVTTGGIYSFDTGGGNTTLGFQPTGSDFAPGEAILKIENTTSNVYSSFNISYDVFSLNNEDRSSSFNFSYAVGDSSIVDGSIDGGQLTYNEVASFDFVSGESAAVSAAWVSETKSDKITLTTSLGSGDAIFLRWSSDDVGGSGSRDEFALDSVSFSAVPEPSSFTYGLIFALTMLGPRRRKA